MPGVFDPVSAALADPARLAALQAADLLDTPAEKTFDRLAQLAARTLRTPIALVSLIDDRRQFFKAQVGLPEPWRTQREIPVSESLCQYLIASRQSLGIPDIRSDDRVRDSVAARELAGVAYLGIPLITLEGHALGAFCVIDSVFRAWTEDDIAAMQVLADAALTEIELRLRQRRLQNMAAQTMAELGTVNEALRAEMAKRTRVKATLREREARLRRIIETMAEGLVLIDRQGRYTIANAASERILGVPRSQIIGSRYDQVPWKRARVNGSVFPMREHPFVLLKKGLKRLQGYEFGIEAPDGRVRIISLNAVPLHDRAGEFDGIVATYIDVTESKRAEESLRASEERFRAIFESAAVGFEQVAPNGRFLAVNPALCSLLGYTQEQLLGKTFIEVTYPGDLAVELAKVGALLSGEIESYELDKRYLRADGTPVWVRLTSSAVREPTGAALYRVSAVEDITERRRAREVLQELNRELEARVRDRTAQLEAANRELEAFSYSVSHDLRAPLRAIDGFSQAVLEEYGDKLDGQGRRYLERVRAGSQRMAELIEDLLGLARVTRTVLKRENASLSELAASIAAELERTDPSRAAQFTVADDLPVSADPRLLRILLENLLGNAWKFSRRTPAARIELGVTEEDGHKVYFVRDNGAGFDMAYADKLFGAFQRLHPASEYEGTGIGLATVQRIVQRHGGRCWAEGEVGRGATFYFTLNESGV